MDLTSWTNCSALLEPQFYEVCSVPPGVEGSKHSFFFGKLCEWATGFSPLFHWVVLIDPNNPDYLTSQITQTIPSFEPSSGSKWDISQGFDATFNDATQKTIGCIFANSVRFQPDKLSTQISMANRGFVSGILTDPREYPHTLEITFNETNSSFTDSVIRPWSILTAHKGLTARQSPESIKATITIYNLGHGNEECGPGKMRKIHTFHDCAPIGVNGSEQKQDTTTQQYDTTFAYNYYTIQTL